MEWNKDFEVGIEKIDRQHQKLFQRINELLVAMKEGKGKAELLQTLKFLEDYVNHHFEEEEMIQTQNNYPKYEKQHAEHEEFRNELKLLKNEFETKGVNVSLVIQVQRKMSEWWKNHITTLDKDLGAYIKQKQ